jgi:hypothetical protein
MEAALVEWLVSHGRTPATTRSHELSLALGCDVYDYIASMREAYGLSFARIAQAISEDAPDVGRVSAMTVSDYYRRHRRAADDHVARLRGTTEESA